MYEEKPGKTVVSDGGYDSMNENCTVYFTSLSCQMCLKHITFMHRNI